ncbi:N-acetylmuramoyl-L-alanine amidase [Sporosarcina sp. FA9]|uniref:N-acetylmuramoyl-L-alanine amidase n=1 Tax=Sporosarcina sp. FA9 TaxID=3413030 RepID=UPI003F656270
MKTIRWAALLILITTLVSVAPVQSSAQVTFSDVKNSDEYFNEVNYISSLGIIKGFPDGKFKPNDDITRFQAAKMLIIATGKQNHITNNVTFTDLPSNAKNKEYYDALSKAVDLGYFKKKTNGSIQPFEKIKREEIGYALAVAFNLSEKVTIDKPLQMDDVRNHQNVDKFNGLYYAGVSQGSNGNFLPNDLLMRKQFSLFVARSLSDKYSLPVKFPEQTSSTSFAKVNTGNDSLNIRSTPSSSNNTIIGKLSTGDIVEVVGTTDEWLHIIYNNQRGYINSNHTVKVDSMTPPDVSVPEVVPPVEELPEVIEPEPEIESPSEVPVTGNVIGKVTVKSLNVRSGPNTSFPVVTSFSIGKKVEVLSLDGYWAKIRYDGEIGYAHKTFLKLLNQSSTPLKDRIIVIDAGHGGTDPGASKNSETEKSVTLKVASLVEAKLKRAGAKVLMTRSNDTYLSLEQRTDFAKKHYAETFVSIHVNAASASAKGTEVWIDTSTNPNGAESKVLASMIQKNIVKDANMTDRGVKDQRFYVIRNNDAAAVLIELGFITNPDDYKKLTSNQYLEIFAESIYQGLVQYYSAN